jgi:hypothetical protein
MDATGRSRAKTAMDEIHVSGGTDIRSGLDAASEILRESALENDPVSFFC